MLQDPEYPTVGVTAAQNPDGANGQTLPVRVCNWNNQLIAYWQNKGFTLQDSIQQATSLAPSYPGSSPFYPGQHQMGWEFTTELPSNPGVSVAFKPDTCLRRIGYGNVRFKGNDSYNSWDDWQHR